MNKIYPILCLALLSFSVNAQVVISELDSDTAGVDDLEFIELQSTTPNYSLDGLVLVFFNGSSAGGDSSYYTIDLDGYTTDFNGMFLIGSQNVSPSPQLLISESVIQNGADGVGIYQASVTDFPDGTLATTTNLLDALVYGVDDADDTVLMNLLGVSEQIDEDENGNKDDESIQRNPDGSYTVATPTPRMPNDGSGTPINHLYLQVTNNQYTEGDAINITFTTDTPVTNQDLQLDFSLANANFQANDFSGNTQVTIPVGASSVSTTITLTDDTVDEGDEELIISVGSLPVPFIVFNDNLLIRVIDNDYQVANFGTPLNPTFGNVSATTPNGYYNSLNGLSGANLKQALQAIIADPSVVRAQTYADVIDILKEADQNPENSNQVWLVYTEQARAKLDYQTTSESTGKWNREHVYPRSRGGFYSIEDDDFADGVDVYWDTNADSIRHGNSDAHALRAVDGPENSSRGNQNFGANAYVGPNNNSGSFKGDVARSIFYMAVRYNGLQVINGYPGTATLGEIGDLQTLLQWHENDPPDDYEMNRNNVVYSWQRNRNPFIDYPELVDYLWGDQQGNAWQTMSVEQPKANQLSLYPNPTTGNIQVSGLQKSAVIKVLSLTGKSIKTLGINLNQRLNLGLPSGMYLLQITTDASTTVKKLVVQ